jgi:hypothetical protein
MFYFVHEKFDFSPPQLPSSAKHPMPTSHPIRLPNPLEYIIDEGKTKYQGEKLPTSLFARYFSIDSPLLSLILFSLWGQEQLINTILSPPIVNRAKERIMPFGNNA